MSQQFTTNSVTITTAEGVVSGKLIESDEIALMITDRQVRRDAELAYLLAQANLLASLETSEKSSPRGTFLEVR